ncbi:30S ribosomal protein S16 [Acidiluteibacter ferrifornacis]|jgi:small subunit ribosomal protein S16|uniref:Small ribosomal subunit protein bS16 n=1 Tax=Acidiluteibacter ferrifornacis TaxID=2692424 RepID=A0A6N9NNN3_9FLAO|nr:30S ribosomal protein S16 [Acidiluteibacter ferrifornacis]MBR9831041.1 30S ribosomal protein S16 [bacterium]NBG67472.1 30S ribosomal protein S16 [Acidiluteibacter ferrifornacis]
MPVKMRLQRHGRKQNAFFHLVVADSRAPRDGRFIEKLGTYNPNTNPATIELDFDKAFDWLNKGAQPTDTVRAILSYKGILYKNHLAKGVAKGALTQEQADEKFNAWLEEKANKVQAKVDGLSAAEVAERKKRAEAEAAANEKKAQEVAAKNAPAVEETPEEEAPAAEATEASSDEEPTAE